ncbi:MAG: CaiB/BaiF CoA transferase family protein [Candidatus Bathyarchaeota archaeon]
MTLSPGDPPLKGIRVLDLSRVLAGPYCSMTLSDLGAEVIKVEIPGRGDDTRAFPPFLEGESSYYLSLNRGKKSLTLNLKDEKGVEVLHRLVKKCDVVLENFRPGVTKRLGVDYDVLKEIKEDLIYCSISSYGQTGPYATRPGYDLIIQGMSGLMGITGEQDRPPVRVGVAVTDLNAGMYAVIAILSALRVRDQLDIGQYLDVSMMDAAVSWMTYMAGSYFANGEVPPRMGGAHPSIVPYQTFEAGDGKFLLVAGGNDRLFKILCEVMDMEHLVVDPMYVSNTVRVENREILVPIIQERLLTKPRDVWLSKLMESGFPCAPVNAMDEVFSDPQLLHRNMLVTMDHPKIGKIKQIGAPLKFSDTPLKLELPPPMLGQHTDEVLVKLCGYSEDEVAALKKNNVV